MTDQFIVWADSLTSDAYQIEALSYEQECDETDTENSSSSRLEARRPPIAASDFVIIYDQLQERRWFGQVIEPQRNLPLLGLSRDNPSQVTALKKVLNNEVEVSVFLKQVYYYTINLLGEIVGDHLQSVRQRPRVGAVGRKAKQCEVLEYMSLPELHPTERCLRNNILGRFHGMPIPVTLDRKRIFYHTLIAGSTGSGKSNTVANYVKAAQAYGMACIVFDHKPDYQNADEANDEKHLFGGFSELGLEPFGLENVDYFAPYKKHDEHLRTDETAITIAAMHVDIPMLAAALFYRPGEELQQETFARLLTHFDESQKAWRLKEFEATLAEHVRNSTVAKLYDGVEPHEKVVGAILTKMMTRKPEWMDGAAGRSTRSGMLGDRALRRDPQYFKPEEHLKPGRVMVIRIPDSSGGREYGLFLSYMLKKVFDLRRTNTIDFPVCVVIDEAQDIFSGSKAIRDSAEGTINSVLRKGRSKQVGFVVAVQSASQVPSSILNNLNSRIIHLQQEEEELRNAMPGTPRELVKLVLSFGPGEALVKLFGARATIHAQMAPSPFMLTKEPVV